MKKLRIRALSFMILLGVAGVTYAGCDGDYIVCTSWIDDINSDILTNCDGDWSGSFIWIDC